MRFFVFISFVDLCIIQLYLLLLRDERGKVMRKIFSFIVFISIVSICIAAHSEQEIAIKDIKEPSTPYSLELAVPFGITHSEAQSVIPLFMSPYSKETFSSVPDEQICEVWASETIDDSVWFCIIYFDSEGNENKGFVRGTDFYQFTIAGLIRIMSDSDISEYLQKYISNKDYLWNFRNDIITATRSSTVAADDTEYRTDEEIERDQYAYIVNKRTKRFHLPSCKSVNDMSNKNLEKVSVPRDELINQGYAPCKNCNP